MLADQWAVDREPVGAWAPAAPERGEPEVAAGALAAAHFLEVPPGEVTLPRAVLSGAGGLRLAAHQAMKF